MKNSKHYSDEIKKFFRTAKQKSAGIRARHWNDPIEAFVYASIAEHVRKSEAMAILKRFEDHFVDLNDLRVSRPEEILDVIGDSDEATRMIAMKLPAALNDVFHAYDMNSLVNLMEEGKRQARKELDDMKHVSLFVSSYVLLTALGGHAIPLNAAMLSYLRDNQMVHPEAEDADIAGFLERLIPASQAYEFYVLLRRQSETGRSTLPSTSSAAKPKKTAKKTTQRRKK
ncbi:MAG: hypothetical protein JXA82_08900 [Sedimentisphaerales bacterium]|nr:hypothetical protein [Sedimentisphaerales bacterium]